MLIKPLTNCAKCAKKCLSKGESIQCDLCGTWAHANYENIARDQYKAVASQVHNCINRVKNIISDCQ